MGLIRLIRLTGLVAVVFLLGVFYWSSKPAKTINAKDSGDSPFGLIGNNAAQAAELNAFWGKVVIPWQLVQPDQDSYQFNEIEQELDSVGPINLVGLIKANAPWAISCRRFVGIGKPCPAKDVNQYAQFVFKTVNHFKERIQVWQIEDEIYSESHFGGSSDEYLALLEAASVAARQADPDATILIASTNLNTNKAYRQRLISVLTHTNLYDVIDLHVAAEPEVLRPTIEQFKDELRSSEIDKPIWVTELKGSEQTPEELVKAHAIAFSLGIKKIFWFGELDELSTKTYSLMASLLTKQSLSSQLAHDDKALQGAAAEAVVFEFTSGKPLAVVWAAGRHEIDPGSLVKPPQQAFDIFGRKLKVSAGKLSISSLPTYLVGKRIAVSGGGGNSPADVKQKARLGLELDRRLFKVGELGKLTIKVDELSGVNLAEVVLKFPADLVRIKRVDHTGSDFGLVLTERIDNTRGLVALTKARVLRSDTNELTLATVSFEAVSPGSGSFSFGSADLERTRLLNLGQQNLLGALTSVDFTVE